MHPDVHRGVVKPFALALGLSAAYVALSSTYIFVSTSIASAISENVQRLEQLELYKGFIFSGVTGVLFFLFAWLLLRRIAAQELRVAQQRAALLESERRAMVGLFASSIAHDIANILVVARGSLGFLEESSPEGVQQLDALSRLRRSLEELRVLTRRMVTIENVRIPDEVADVELDALVREVVALARSHMDVRGCTVRVPVNDPVTMRGNKSMIGMMLLNLILNAADATRGRGRIDVYQRRVDDSVVIEVHDDGPGVPQELREKVFTAFFSSKTHGTGLGLLSVKVTVEAHGGTVEVGESELGGALFRVTLPRTPRATT
jgi:two-component system sensor histidine kinase HydH